MVYMSKSEVERRFKVMEGTDFEKITVLAQLNACTQNEIRRLLGIKVDLKAETAEKAELLKNIKKLRRHGVTKQNVGKILGVPYSSVWRLIDTHNLDDFSDIEHV